MSNTLVATSSPKRIEFLVITKNEALLSASREVAEHFEFYSEFCDSLETVDAEVRLGTSPLMTLIQLEEGISIQEKMHILGTLREVFPRTQIVVVMQGGETIEDCDFLRGAGAQYLLFLQEIKGSSKLYYLAALLVQGTYLPVPVTDLFPGTELNFNGYHKLVLNQKFLPIVFSGFTFSDKKYRKLEPIKQIFIRRESLDEYRKYIETYHDRTGAALKKRCRSTMMTLLGIYTEVALLLVLDSEVEKKDLLNSKILQFIQVSLELGDYLKDCPDVWNVIAQALDFKFCDSERSVQILAYAVYLASKAQVGSLEELVRTALFADVGLFDLPPSTYKSLQKNGVNHLSAEDLEIYKSHPMASLNRVLFRQLEVSVEVRSNIVCTHEQNDLQGFPNQVPADKIPLESKLIYFCQLLDRRIHANLKEGMVTHDFIRRQVWEEEKVSLKRFSADFLDKIEKVLIA